MTNQHDEQSARMRSQRERQYEIDSITFQYSEEYRQGRHPRIQEYVRRYPQYASELLDYALYFHTVGFDSPPLEEPADLALSPESAAALARIWERSGANAPDTAPASADAPITSLSARGMALKLAPPQLAAAVGLTTPLLARLEAHKIAVATIPRTLIQRLADALKTAPEVIGAYLGATQAGQAGAFYYADQQPTEKQESFLDAVQASALTPEQKREWAEVIKTDAGANP